MSNTTVLALVGSLRAGSVNRRLAETAITRAPEGATVSVFEGLGELPFYNEDLDGPDAPAIPAVEALREAAGAADAFLLVTPEYNGTMSAVLKNAIDWISRPFQAGAIKNKPVAVVSASPSPNAAQWAHADARKAARVAGGNVIEDVTLAIGGTIDKFGDGHPRDNVEVSDQIAEVVGVLVDATRQLVDA